MSVRFPNPLVGLANKLLHKFYTEFIIIKKKIPLTYVVRGTATGRLRMTVHLQRLKP